MSDEDDPPPGEPRTVFIPTGASAAPVSPPPEATAVALPPAAPIVFGAPPPAQGAVQVGAVLNGIYEVKRLIARGGMGEVFEGVNVNDDHDRVAIKVMLPALAADPNVQAMFRKESRTLTRLSHPAVVQYRVLAQEPLLGVFYIVTEFLDGEPLSDLIGRAQPTSADLRGLMRRLAEGLKSAHDLGAVHRDISPDNILLPGSRLDRAKIIDFGIAKEMDPSKATIVGDGFAGKLGYVAPEQLGDFGRQVGPWTDVYSLALVILTFAGGKPVDMGATLVDAVDRRRAGPDIGVAPADLQPILRRMLAPNPVDRARSMDEVLEMLDGAPAEPTSPTPPPPTSPAKPGKAVKTAPPLKPPEAAKRSGPPLPLIIGGAVAALAVAGVGGVFLMGKKAAPSSVPTAASSEAGAPTAEAARQTIEGALTNVSCSWLNVASATPSGSGVAVKLTGVAGSSQAANAAVLAAAKSAKIQVPDVDLVDVLPIDPPVCAPLDAFRPFRADTSALGAKLSSSQAKYTLEKQPDGKISQHAVITMAIANSSSDFALYGIEPSGEITTLIDNRAKLQSYLAANNPNVQNLGQDNYRLAVETTHTGLSGMLLLYGKGPFDTQLIAGSASAHVGDWANRVRAAAQASGWKAEMVWYKTVGADAP